MRGARGPGKGLRRHRGFGLTFSSEVEMPGLRDARGLNGRAPDLEILAAARAEVDELWSGPAPEPAVARATLDGVPYTAERGASGDHRFDYGELAAFHLSSGARTLRCAPADEADPAWRRVLLDSVLATVALLHGFEAVHASAVAAPSGVVAFIGGTGGGKTTLAAELVRRGYPLVCDDILALRRDATGAVLGHPGPPVMNLPHGAPDVPARRIATFAGEDWVAVERVAEAPQPVAAICLLDRRDGLTPAIRPAETSAVDLLAHGLRSGSDPQRLRARFELLADLAAQAPAFVLEAATATSPGDLADLAASGMPALRAPDPAGASR